jgi:hypothetical protein
LSEFANPYRVGEPVSDPGMLFGRRDAADWIELQVGSDNRILVLSALPLIGKTSFLKHTGSLQSLESFNLLVSLSELPIVRASDQEYGLNAVLQLVLNQLLPQLTALGLAIPHQTPTAPQSSSSLREIFNQVNQHLPVKQRLILYIDDLHLLVTQDLALIASFLTSLMPLLDICPRLYIVFAVNQDKLKVIRHPLLDGAPIFNLGVISPDASINMITTPVKNVLRFDYGVTKRIAEVNSHHPYYLSLYCHTLLDRQVYDGWVNQQDFDTTLTEILASPIEPFKQIWDEASWAERGVLAGMAAIQGAHGPITNQEIIRFLQRKHSSVIPEVVLYALQSLAERGVLVPMGAISYRFHVELFRFWLKEHTDPAEILTEVDWVRTATQLRTAARESRAQPAPRRFPNPEERRAAKKRSLWPVIAIALALLGCVGVTASGLFASQLLNLPLPLGAQATPLTVPDAPLTKEIAPLADAADITPTPPPVPTEPPVTPTPTPALVVARTLPSITFMGRDVDQNWRIYVMNVDGSEATPLSGEGGDDTSPVWSPNGQQIAFVSLRDGNREIYIMDSQGGDAVNVTRHPADDWTPAWSPDGTKLAFSSFREGSWEIFVLDTACFNTPETCPERMTQLTTDGNGSLSPAWSPDGSRLAYNSKANGNWDIYTMNMDGTDVRQVTVTPDNDLAPVWSPDGSQLAYESNQDGNVEIYVIGANGGVPRNVSNLSLADDHGPTWSPDGQQLVFYSNREGNWDVFVTTVDGGTVVNLTQTPARDEQTPAWRP